MTKSPTKSRFNYEKYHTGFRYLLAVGIFATLIMTVIFSALSGTAMAEVHEEGSNPHNAGDASLTENEQDFKTNSMRAQMTAIYTVLLTLIYIAAKL